MRIAIYHNLPSGGAKRTLSEATKHLARRHSIDVYTLSSADHEFADLRPFVSAHHIFNFKPARLLRSPWGRFNQLLRAGDLLRLSLLNRKIARQIESRPYDVVLVHPCRFSQAPSILRYLRRTPSAYYCHEPLRKLHEPAPWRPYDGDRLLRRKLLNRLDPLLALYYSLLRRMERKNTRAATLVLVNSRFTANSVAAIHGVDAKVCLHGVDTKLFRPVATQREHMVLGVGSLTPLKGFDFLIQAMALYPHRPRPRLVIASNFQNRDEREYLLGLADELAVEVEFLSGVDDERLLQLYRRAGVVTYAPMREPFGLVPLEAMACGAPVVGIDEGGVPESIVHGETGLLVTRDPGRFAAAIHDVICDAQLAQRLGANARAHVVQNWAWEDAVLRLEAYLADACALASPKGRQESRRTSLPVTD